MQELPADRDGKWGFGRMDQMRHEQVVFGRDEETGSKTIIGMHHTNLGPALGGTGMWDYHNEEEALRRTKHIYDATLDILQLSETRGILTTHAALQLAQKRIDENR